MLEAVGLGDRKDFRPRDLSGGQRQRVAVARALAGPASVILADEPTGNLDSESGKRVLALFRDLSRSEGRALLIVTHDPLVRTIADRIVTIRDGRLIPRGGLNRCRRTMILGRVVLPAAGLVLAAALTWHSVRNDHGSGRKSSRSAAVVRTSDRPAGSPPRGGSSPIPAPR